MEVLGNPEIIMNVKPDLMPDMKKVKKTLVQDLQMSTLHGVKNVTVLSVKIKNRDTLVVIFGEVHNNPSRCGSEDNAMEVVIEVVVKYLFELQPVVLILETFFHLEKKDIKKMEKVLNAMKSHGHPFHKLAECLRNTHDRECIYKNKSTALKFLRMLTSAVRFLALHMGAGSHLDMLSKRIHAMDPREDLKMIPPFRELLGGREPTTEEMVASIENVTRKELSKYIPDIHPEAFGADFKQCLWDPFFRRRDDFLRKPTLQAYTQLFLDVPDVVGVAHLLAVLGHAEANNMMLPIIFFYVGDSHRRAIHRLLQCLSVVSVEEIFSHSDPSGGSCVKPPF